MHKLNIKKVFRRTHDPIWQLQAGVVIIIILQLLTNDSFLPYNKLFIVGFEALLVLFLSFVTSDGYGRVSPLRRVVAISLIGSVALFNIFSLVFLIQALLFSHLITIGGVELLQSGLTIYATNIFMFALLYWEMDGGGPDRRVNSSRKRDFIFPQMIHRDIDPDWLPGFVDYLYLSGTNVTNFASADTVPVSHRAKLLMMVQAFVSVAAVVLVAARAISILA